MPVLPLLIGTSTALGVGYFCVDLYRNRRRLATPPNPGADTNPEFLPMPENMSLQSTSHAIARAEHSISEAANQCASGVEHCAEAIGHILSHH